MIRMGARSTEQNEDFAVKNGWLAGWLVARSLARLGAWMAGRLYYIDVGRR